MVPFNKDSKEYRQRIKNASNKFLVASGVLNKICPVGFMLVMQLRNANVKLKWLQKPKRYSRTLLRMLSIHLVKLPQLLLLPRRLPHLLNSLTFGVVVLLPLTANVMQGSQVESQTLTPTGI